MTFALTAFVADGQEMDEAVTKRFRQRAIFTITAANTDVALDIGNYTGTFWTAVGGSTVGAKALLAIKDIQIKAKSYFWTGGTGLAGKVPVGATSLGLVKLTGTISGGAATEIVTVTGLATTDTILAVSMGKPNGTATVAVTGYATQATDALTLSFAANPGAAGVANVLVQRAVGATATAGSYILGLNATNTQIPDITFASGSAPTAYTVVIEWELLVDQTPVQIAA
jgi:hypothetical protein